MSKILSKEIVLIAGFLTILAAPMMIQTTVELRRGDEVRCCRSNHTVKLVRLGDSGFFDVLRSKLSWGEL